MQSLIPIHCFLFKIQIIKMVLRARLVIGSFGVSCFHVNRSQSSSVCLGAVAVRSHVNKA